MNGTYTEPQQFDDDYAEIGEEVKAGCPLEKISPNFFKQLKKFFEFFLDLGQPKTGK